MIIDIPDGYIPMLLSSGIEMGRLFSRATAGSIDCLLLARQIIENHPDDLEKFLADFFFGVKTQENSRG